MVVQWPRNCYTNNAVTNHFDLSTQGSHIKIRTTSELPVHVDGEPWIQPPGDIVVLRSALRVSYRIGIESRIYLCRMEEEAG